uniref:Uncharacterized protein n=1 Tax=Glossina palpalis gambiensis TaxID=67801 RepID=A0A1B0C6L6_9MUSC
MSNNAQIKDTPLCLQPCSVSSLEVEKSLEYLPTPKACRSRELRCGIMYTTCDCIKRNGLQDKCPRSLCQGRSACMCFPTPNCCPSSFPLRYANMTMGVIKKKNTNNRRAGGSNGNGNGNGSYCSNGNCCSSNGCGCTCNPCSDPAYCGLSNPQCGAPSPIPCSPTPRCCPPLPDGGIPDPRVWNSCNTPQVYPLQQLSQQSKLPFSISCFCTSTCYMIRNEDYRRALMPFSNEEPKRPIFSPVNPCSNYPPLTNPFSCLCVDGLQQPSCFIDCQTTSSDNCFPPEKCNCIFLMNCNCGPTECPNFSQLLQERRNGLQKNCCGYNKDVKEYERALIPFADGGKINKRRPIFSAAANFRLQDPWSEPCCDNMDNIQNFDFQDIDYSQKNPCFMQSTSIPCGTGDKAGILDPCNGYPCLQLPCLQQPCYDPCFANYRMPCVDPCYSGFQTPSSCNSVYQIIESNIYDNKASDSNTYPNNRCGCPEGFICISCDPEIPTTAEICCRINVVLPQYLQGIAEKARCCMPNNAQIKDTPLCLQPCSVSSLEAEKSLEYLPTVNILNKNLS